MNVRTIWVLALLAAPVLSQEATTTVSAPSFDLRSEAIKKVVRDIAAEQSAAVQVTRETEPKPAVRFVPAEKKDPPKPTPWRVEPPPMSSSVLAAFAQMAVLQALHVDDDIPDPQNYCPWGDDLVYANTTEACHR